MTRMKTSIPAVLAALLPGLPRIASAQDALAQFEQALDTSTLAIGEGWAGFLEIGFLFNTLLTLLLATVLGACIAFHPRHIVGVDTIEEIEVPKVYMLYSVIGALMGILVVKYGLVVGMVLFGIGGLIRFRTLLESASLTGRVIFVTLIGLTCGLDLPHIAVIATLFAFLLIYVIEARVVYRVDVRALEPQHVAAAAAAYRTLLKQHGCKVVAEKKNPEKGRITLLISEPRGQGRDRLEALLESGIDGPLKGSVDWQTD